MMRILFIILAAIVVIPGVLIGIEIVREPGRDEPSVAVADVSEQIAKGNYLARAGDCMACHTARGGSSYAGGRRIPTPFGDIFSPNITPDTATGIGSWTSNDFWRALHNGKSKDGSFLYPAFPYPNYTKVTRADSDAIFAYIKTLSPVHRPNQPHQLRFPYNQRLLLAGWRALYFRPGIYSPNPGQSNEWNRGAYLVQGLGHCNACHTNRNVLGATETRGDLAGGMIPMLNWYAPSLTSDAEAGLGDWQPQHIADLLKTGISPRGTVFGPMAEVVRESLQYLSDRDILAMGGYLKALPQTDPASKQESIELLSLQEASSSLKLGAALYEKHCADCHQATGEGVPPAYPPLAGNRSINTPSAINSIRMIVNGGFPPSTTGNPRPFGMPPFGPAMDDVEVAAVVSYIRNSWGNRAEFVSPVEVSHYRSVPLD
jgi:mono/diheme cytochrome c family protein